MAETIVAVFTATNAVKITKSRLIEYLSAGVRDVYLDIPTFENRLLVSLIAWSYSFCLQQRPDLDVTIIPRVAKVEETPDMELVELKPFNEDRVNLVCFGGTFDHLHAGHRLLITAAAILAKHKIVIGVSRKAGNKEFSEFVQPLPDRIANVTRLIFRVNEDLIVSVEPLDGISGPAGILPDIDLLLLSEETIKGGEYVNRERKGRGLNELHFAAIPLILKNGERLCSTYLRRLEAGK